jgi:hypothetical protein
MVRILLSIIVFLSLVGCGSTLEFIDEKKGVRNTKNVYLPVVNQKTSASLGERLMYQASGTEVDCLTPLVTKNDAAGFGTFSMTLQENIELCANSVGSNMFFSDNKILSYNANSTIEYKKFVLEEKLNDGSSNLCWTGSKGYCLNFKDNELSRRTKFVIVPNTLQQSIEYMGSDGSIAKFIYSELSDNRARPAFNRDFQVDLSKGDTVNFKGAEVEIISATNTTIEYRVLKYFN